MSPVVTATRTAPDLSLMLTEIEELPTIPETLVQVLRVIDDPESGATDLAQIVRLDVPLSAKILRLANSPYYGSRNDITDVSRSIAVLGYRTMRNVAISLTVATSMLGAVARSGSRVDYRELWKHSVVTGAVAKALAAFTDDPEPEEIFAAGLLHDLGKFVLALHGPESYHEVLETAAREQRDLSDFENESFGFDHADVGAAFAESWRFPDFLSQCIGGHHHVRPPAPDGMSRTDRAGSLIGLADHLAHELQRPRAVISGSRSSSRADALHAAAGVSPALVAEKSEIIHDTINLATVFLRLT